MNYWDIITDNLSEAGWSLGYVAVAALNIGEHLLPYASVFF